MPRALRPLFTANSEELRDRHDQDPPAARDCRRQPHPGHPLRRGASLATAGVCRWHLRRKRSATAAAADGGRTSDRLERERTGTAPLPVIQADDAQSSNRAAALTVRVGDVAMAVQRRHPQPCALGRLPSICRVIKRAVGDADRGPTRQLPG